MSLPPREGPSRTYAALRWTVAGLLVVGAHAGAGWWAVTHPFAQAIPPDTVQGITIDLEPVAVQQNAPEPNATTASGAVPTPQVAAAPEAQSTPLPESPPPDTTAPPPEPPPPPDPAPPPPEPPPPVPEPPPVMEPEPQPKPAPVPVPEAPPLPPPESKTDAVLAPAPPPPKPRPPKPLPPRPDPRRVALDAARRRASADRREAARAARAAAQAARNAAETQAPGGRSDQAAAPSSASSGASVATWRGEVVAHLNAYKPASPNGASGTARVAFSVDRAGRVLSASLAGSSGDAALDAAALAMVRRASPVPAPPPDLGGRVSLAVPVWFH